MDARLKDLAKLASSKHAENVVVIEVIGLCSFTDYIVVCHGRSDRQVQSIARHIEESMKKMGEKPIGVEGMTQGHWVLIDYGDVVVHVFFEPVRRFYDIEGLWPDAKRLDLAS